MEFPSQVKVSAWAKQVTYSLAVPRDSGLVILNCWGGLRIWLAALLVSISSIQSFAIPQGSRLWFSLRVPSTLPPPPLPMALTLLCALYSAECLPGFVPFYLHDNLWTRNDLSPIL